MQISEPGLELIERFEGYSFRAYWDAYGGVWTVGFGETSGVTASTTQTFPQAQADLARRLVADYEPSIRALGVPLSQNQWDALCSFVWNLGAGSMSASWTIGRLLRERNYQAAANSMLSYVRAGGVVLQGLVTRREAERTLFLTSDPLPADPHHYRRFEDLSFDGVNERATVQLYDELRVHGVRNRAKLEPVRAHLTFLAQRVAKVSGAGTKSPTWGEDWRGWRYQELLRRSRGESVAG
jgi:lysozyme